MCVNTVQLKSHQISNINCSDKFGNTSLHLAAMNGRKQIVIVLLQSGIDATLHNARSTTPSFLQLIVVVGFIVFMAALCNRGAIIFLSCSFYLLSFFLSFFLFFPRLISAAADWMSTILLHMAWP